MTWIGPEWMNSVEKEDTLMAAPKPTETTNYWPGAFVITTLLAFAAFVLNLFFG